MGLQETLAAIYCVIAFWAMLKTQAERRAKGHTNFANNIAGMVACALWPAVVVYFMLPDWSAAKSQLVHSSDI